MYCTLLKMCYNINSVYCKCGNVDFISSEKSFKIL